MQLLWIFSAFALIGAVASARGDCTQLPTFLGENDEGEPKIAAAMKEGMSAIVVNLLLLGDQITPPESYEKAEQCDSSCAQNPLCVGSNYFPNQTCLLFSSLTSRQRNNAVGVRSYYKDYTALCKTIVYGCPPGWTYFDGAKSCYKNLLTRANFSTAMKMCEDEAAKVVLPKTQNETNFLAKAFPDPVSGFYWLGATRSGPSFVDAYNGSPLHYVNWFDNEPDSNVDCVFVNYGYRGRWFDAPCTYAYYVLCEKDATIY